MKQEFLHEEEYRLQWEVQAFTDSLRPTKAGEKELNRRQGDGGG